MVDNNLARNRNDGPDFFADDDPLAELARIVGYDERLVPKPPVVERREPAFNLEDELLQEFERYDAPRPHQSAVQPAVVEPEPVTEQTVSEPPEAFEAAPHDDTAELDWSAVEDTFAEGFPRAEVGIAVVEPLVDLGLPHGDVEPIDWNRDRAASEQSLEAALPGEEMEQSAVVDISSAVADDQLTDEPVLDLADELELTLGEPEISAPAPVHPEPVLRAEPPKRGSYTPGFRMPLANFNTNRDLLRPVASSKIEPVADLPASPAINEPPVETASAEINRPPAVETASISLAPEQVSAVAVQEAPAAAAPASEFADLDALINDISRYPIIEPITPRVGSENDGRVQSRPVDFGAETVVQPVETKQGSSDASRSAAPAADFLIDPVIDDEFDLALDDLELDLSDIMSNEDLSSFAEPKPSVPAMAPAAPVRHTATWSPIARFSPSLARSTPVGPAASSSSVAPAVAAVQPMPAVPVVPTSAPKTQVEPENIPDLPFDPALIAESEEHPEAVVELDVPELHVEEQDVPVQRNDYDFDLDAELASLLQSAGSGAADDVAAVEPEPAPIQAAQPAAPSTYPDLDDFERALEEDFRRSLTTPLPPLTDMGDVGAGRSFEGSRRSLSSLVIPLAVAGVVIAGGSIGYMILGGDGASVASNGEPVVIAADTDPVKVLPENPGGKTVPNQDKAVYDRVAGAAVEAPKQESLISTNEEPVDVVQKTLMTDTLPLEGEEFASALEAEATEDRLLPQNEQLDRPAPDQDQQSVGVTPRRVKTMIVRPDGTLVEQELPAAPAPVAAATTPAATGKLPAANVKAEEVASAPDASVAGQSGAAALVPASAEIGSSQLAPTMAPVTGEAAVGTPIPTARPAAQPADDVAALVNQNNAQPVSPTPVTPAAPAPAAAAPEAPANQVASVPTGGYVIQIASLPSEADAQKSYQNLSSKFGSVIGGRGVDIKQAQIEGKGTFYRVRIPAGSKEDAVALCEKYRAAGGSCLVAK